MAHISALNDVQVPEELDAVRKLPSNKTCFDCGGYPAGWASVTYGIFLCLNCGGIHRSLGTHISFVRSLTLDSWTPAQIASMKLGGNERARQHFTQPYTSSYDKYNSIEAREYGQLLKADVVKEIGLPEDQVRLASMPLDPVLQRFAGSRSIGSADLYPEDETPSSGCCWC